MKIDTYLDKLVIPKGNPTDDFKFPKRLITPNSLLEEAMSKRVAIVTGAASGIGKAIAKALARNNVKVIIADLDDDGGQIVAESIGGYFVLTDLSQRIDCQTLVDYTLTHHDRIDILVNNAGFQHVNPIEKFPEDTWEKMLSVMLTAPFLLTKYVWPIMKKNSWGRIVNIASIHSRVASPFKSGYVTAKHGLIGLTRTAALEGGAYGITVNALCPAYVQTPLVENQIAEQTIIHDLSKQEVIKQVMLEPAAIKRLISPEEVAALVVFLCSETASAITGSDWAIDLGWTAR